MQKSSNSSNVNPQCEGNNFNASQESLVMNNERLSDEQSFNLLFSFFKPNKTFFSPIKTIPELIVELSTLGLQFPLFCGTFIACLFIGFFVVVHIFFIKPLRTPKENTIKIRTYSEFRRIFDLKKKRRQLNNVRF